MAEFPRQLVGNPKHYGFRVSHCGEVSEAKKETALFSSALDSLHLEFSTSGFPIVLELTLSGPPVQKRARTSQPCLGATAKH